MTDIALIALSGDTHDDAFDLMLNGPDLATEAGLETAIHISLNTDGRAHADDVIPDGSGDRRGWWGDAFADVDGDEIGSRLWLLKRAKILPETIQRAQDYAGQALAWLVQDGVAKAVNAEAVRQDPNGISISVAVTRPDGRIIKFDNVWSSIDGLE
jgi:phage gp46-like protein